MEKAILLFNEEKYDEALALFNEFLKEDPRNAGLLNNIGTIYFKQGDFDDAIDAYHSGIQADPKLKQLYKNLSDVYLKKGEVLSAIGILQDAVAFMPKENYLRYALAKLYIMDCRGDIAVDELLTIIENDPNHLDARYDLAKAYFELGVYPSACEQYDYILEKIENSAHLFYNAGLAYEANEDIDKAISNYLKALNVDETFHPAYKKLALCFLARDEKQDAIEYLEDYVQFDIPEEEKISMQKVIERLKKEN